MKKIIVVLLLFSLLLCALACDKPSIDKNSGDDTLKPNQNDAVETQPYDDIVEKYTDFLLAKANNEETADLKDPFDDIEATLLEIVRDCTDPFAMGYATKDLNGDRVDELVLLNKSNKLYALFTIKNSVPVLLLKMDKMSAHISSDGTVYAYERIKDKGYYTYIKKITDGTLEGLEYGTFIEGEDISYYKIDNGVRTESTRDEILQLDNSIQNIMINPLNHNKITGFRFVCALQDSSVQDTAPVVDFSSYDGILSAYKIIVESFSEYSQGNWINGKFDNLFNISDNDTYEIFHEIFYRGIQARPTETYFGQDYAKDGDNSYGYAKKDLNGDGIEELLLLTDNYDIIAIFTMKDGKATFLDGACGAWIDENGYVRKDVSTGGLVSRDGEVFVYEINGAELNTIIGVGYKVNIYLEKEGWYKIDGSNKTEISKEEGEAMYAKYDILPSDYSNKEYTKTFSEIEFVPLFEVTLASQKHLNTFSQTWFINGDTLTVSDISESSVAFTFKHVHTVGEFDPETNPDPEVHIITMVGEAVCEENQYGFETDGVKGYIEFAVNSVWLVVTESENEYVECRAYLFDYPEN